jgi:hypothetical protein
LVGASGLFIFDAWLDAEFPYGLLPIHIMRARISNWWGGKIGKEGSEAFGEWAFFAIIKL